MAGETPMKDRFHRDDVEIPTGRDIARQLVIVGVVLLAWFGSFNFAMNLPTETAASARADERRAERIRAAMTADSTQADSMSTAATDPSPAAESSEATTEGATASGGQEAVAEAPDAVPSETMNVESDDVEPVDVESVPVATGPVGTAVDPDPAEPEPDSAEPDPVMAMENEAAMSNMPDVSDHPPVSFEADVMPIIASRCLQCHGEPRDDGTLRIEEGLDMRTHEAIMAGSTWGDVVVPGDPVGSYMLELILDGEMPDEGPRLLPREVRIITAWIAQGAPDN